MWVRETIYTTKRLGTHIKARALSGSPKLHQRRQIHRIVCFLPQLLKGGKQPSDHVGVLGIVGLIV